MSTVYYLEQQPDGTYIIPKTGNVLNMSLVPDTTTLQLTIDETRGTTRNNLEAPPQASGDVLVQGIQQRLEHAPS